MKSQTRTKRIRGCRKGESQYLKGFAWRVRFCIVETTAPSRRKEVEEEKDDEEERGEEEEEEEEGEEVSSPLIGWEKDGGATAFWKARGACDVEEYSSELQA